MYQAGLQVPKVLAADVVHLKIPKDYMSQVLILVPQLINAFIISRKQM
jgi:hypothetical protein